MITEDDRQYLLEKGWEEVIEDDTWHFPWGKRSQWSEPYNKSTQVYWDPEEALALQKEIDGRT